MTAKDSFTRRFFWRVFPLTLLVALAALAAISLLAGSMTRKAFLVSVERDLEVRATMLVPMAKEAFLSEDPEPFDTLCKKVGADTGTRFTLILPSGRVVGDSAEEPEVMLNHADRAEIRLALDGTTGTSTRFSATVQQPLMYVAVPVREGGRILGVARASVPIDFIDAALEALYRRMALGGLAVAALAAALSFVVARRLSRPLEEIHESTRRLLGGASEPPIPISDSTEIGALAEAVNRMVFELDERLRTTLRHNRELEAILGTMVDGVLVTDIRGHVVRINEAARELLKVKGDVVGQPLSEAVAHRALPSLIERIVSTSTPIEEELSLGAGGVRPLDARGMPLRDSYERTTGALVVLTDKTRVRRLETLRRDFAAHVSHELRTPITAVQGFADTLLSGALDEPDEARRFVGFIAEQSRRLERLVDGLLDLAKIERRAERQDLERAWHHLGPLLESVVSSLGQRVLERNAAIAIDCQPNLAARVNAPLVERAVANLVDNALRYTPPASRISIQAREDSDHVTVSVSDDGEGIPAAELERLFERFYRVPRSRGQNPQGSGLGLAIVKHIALAHGGSVQVKSALGEGTTFEIRLAKY